MKIRNLQEFIIDRCSRKDVNSLDYLFSNNKNDEPFLTAILGDEGDVDNMVEKCASFAKDPEQQVFYEFVQNAFDANANNAYFNTGSVGGKDYLLILNDGKPFYTDPKGTTNKREGQLFSFLNKGKSDKANSPLLGEYGMGSKLLYTLLADCSEEFSLAQLMKPAIIDNRRGPYLLSWADGTQLDNFLQDRNIWDRTSGYDNTEFLIAKIFCCYYPLEPGVDKTLFSDEETSELVNVFNNLVDPKRKQHTFRSRGSAIIIPLGKGKLQMLNNTNLINKVGDCLAPFSSIIKGYKEFKDKHLSHISFMGREINEINDESVLVEIEKKNQNKYRYQFVFDESFISEKTVNLYKALPISDAVYNLNFIIDSLDLPIDDSRQAINDVDVAINNISSAMKLLVEKLDDIKRNNRERFKRIYHCLLSSRPDNDIVKIPFDNIIKPYLKNNILLINGNYASFDTTVILDSQLTIPITDFGITNISVADSSIEQDYTKLGLDISHWGLRNVIEQADKKMLSKWIQELSTNDYAIYHSEVLNIIRDFPEINLLRTNRKNIVSYQKVLSEDTYIYFCDVAQETFKGNDLLEYVELPLNTAKPNSSEEVIYNKLKKHKSELHGIEALNLISSILCNIDGIIPSETIRREFDLLQNLKGDVLPFNDIFKQTPTDTILFEPFAAKAPLPLNIKNSWFVSDGEIWDWLNHNWKSVKKLNDWKKYYIQYIKDIKLAWDKSLNKNKTKIELYLDKNGEPLDDAYFYIKGTLGTFSEEDYIELETVFSPNLIVPYQFRGILSKEPFVLRGLTLYDMFSNETKAISITFKQLLILTKTVDCFWDKYHVEIENEAIVISLLSAGCFNYWTNIELNREQIQNLSEAGFKQISNRITCPDGKYIIEKNSLLLEDAIDKVHSIILLFPIVKKCTSVLDKFCEKLENIEFSCSEIITKNDLRWDIIKYFSDKKEFIDCIWGKIVIDNCHLPSGSLCPNLVTVGDNKKYNAYELLPRLATEDSIVKSLLRVIPNQELFERAYCKKRRSSISAKEVLDEMSLDNLSVYQLEFALDCANHGEIIESSLKLTHNEDLINALEMIFRRKFKSFYKLFCIDGFHPESQIFATKDILLDSEIIPETIYNWIASHKGENILELFDNSLWHNHFLLEARRAIKESKSFCINRKEIDDEESWILDNTFNWIVEAQRNHFTISHGSNVYEIVRNLQSLIRPSDDNTPYLLKYYSSLIEEKIQYELCLPNDKEDIVFLSIDSKDHRERICSFLKEKNSKLMDFFSNYDLYVPLKEDSLMRTHMLANNKIISIKHESTKDSSWREWDSKTYKKWLKLPESNNIHIYITHSTISSRLRFMDNDKSLMELPIQEGASYGHSIDNMGLLSEIAVMTHDDQETKIFKSLEIVAKNLKDFQQPFIALQGLKLEELLQNEKDKYPIGVEPLYPIPYPKEIEPEKESEKNQISGYIGELLFFTFLDRIGASPKWEALNGEGRYDISVDNERFYEIKTNVRTIKDGEAPFYLHKSQMEFLHNSRTEQYFLCRISLTDLGLDSQYQYIRKKYRIDNNPIENENFKMECDEVVNDFWKIKDNINLFKESIRQYRIKDMYNEIINK